MAKLSAHGAELRRMAFESISESGTRVTTFRALMEDGAILERRRFEPRDTPAFSDGWRLLLPAARPNATVTLISAIAERREMFGRMQSKGWREVAR